MTSFRNYALAIATLALVSCNAAQAQGAPSGQALKQEVKQDAAKLRVDRAAERAATRPAEPEGKRAAVMSAAKQLKVMIDQKHLQVAALEQQAAAEKDPGKRRDLEKQIGALNHKLSGLQSEYGDALLYNVMPNPARFQ